MRGSGPGATVWRRRVKLASFHAKSQRRKGSSGQVRIEWPGEIVRRAAGYPSTLSGFCQSRCDCDRVCG
jgi:hypothetical protein